MIINNVQLTRFVTAATCVCLSSVRAATVLQSRARWVVTDDLKLLAKLPAHLIQLLLLTLHHCVSIAAALTVKFKNHSQTITIIYLLKYSQRYYKSQTFCCT